MYACPCGYVCKSRAFYALENSMLRWNMQDLADWKWDDLRAEVQEHLPLRWWMTQHIAANPRDIDLTFAPYTKAYLEL